MVGNEKLYKLFTSENRYKLVKGYVWMCTVETVYLLNALMKISIKTITGTFPLCSMGEGNTT